MSNLNLRRKLVTFTGLSVRLEKRLANSYYFMTLYQLQIVSNQEASLVSSWAQVWATDKNHIKLYLFRNAEDNQKR